MRRQIRQVCEIGALAVATPGTGPVACGNDVETLLDVVHIVDPFLRPPVPEP